METKYINTPEWDKTFALSDKVNHKKVSFTNRYGICLIGDLPFLTFSLLDHADEIRSAVLVVHGENAYSLPTPQEAFGKLKGDNKELMIIPGASHTDLYDRIEIIPFDRIEAFFRKHLR